MFKATIYNRDGSVHWTTKANTLEELEKWYVICQEQKNWEDGRSVVYEDITPPVDNARVAIYDAIKYLKETDWQVLEAFENGTELDAQVKAARAAARALVYPK